jgi:hypothetical protein
MTAFFILEDYSFSKKNITANSDKKPEKYLSIGVSLSAINLLLHPHPLLL